MGIASSFGISASGLTAERVRMDVISNNLANINTTRTATGAPYRRRQVVLASDDTQSNGFAGAMRSALGRSTSKTSGVRVAAIQEDTGPLKRVYDPGNPDADKTGYVNLPNVEPVMEMVDLISTSRAYDAGVSALGAAKQMQQTALEIGKV